MISPKLLPFRVALKSTRPVPNPSCWVVYSRDINNVKIQYTVIDMDSVSLAGAIGVVTTKFQNGSMFQSPQSAVTRDGSIFSYMVTPEEGGHVGRVETQLVVTISGVEFATQKCEFIIES